MQINHHDQLVRALRAHWRDAGGPLSLTGFLRECRPSIAPLLARGVQWRWIGPRVLAVFENPDAEVPPDLEPLAEGKMRSLVELFSRSRRRIANEIAPAFSAATVAASHRPEVPHQGERALPARESGADPPENRRARIRQSAAISQKLGQFD